MISRQLFRVNCNIAHLCFKTKGCGNVGTIASARLSSTVDNAGAVAPTVPADQEDESVFLYSRNDINNSTLLDAKAQLELSKLREKLLQSRLEKVLASAQVEFKGKFSRKVSH